MEMQNLEIEKNEINLTDKNSETKLINQKYVRFNSLSNDPNKTSHALSDTQLSTEKNSSSTSVPNTLVFSQTDNNYDKSHHMNLTLNQNKNNNNNYSYKRRSDATGSLTQNEDNFSSNTLATDKLNQEQLNLRLREILVYSYMFVIFFASPIACISLYYGLKASNQIKDENLKGAEKSLRKAHYINLSAFIVGSLMYITSIIVAVIFLMATNSCT